jgi:hypothetical protein
MPSSFIRLVAFACVIGYAVPAVAAPHAAPPVTIVNVDPSLDGLSAEARATYARLHVALESRGPKPTEYQLTRGGRLLTEHDFRGAYRDVTHSTDLDVEARARAKRKNGRAIAGAVGLTLLGIGGLTTLGLVQPSVCSRAANAQSPGGCAKVGESVVILALMSGYGIYSLGCEAVKGVNCLLDGNIAPVGNELTQAAALPFVDRYNTALVAALRAGVALNRLGPMGAPPQNARP